MGLSEPYHNLFELIASAADICLKPWRHAVVMSNVLEEHRSLNDEEEASFLDLSVRIESRDSRGKRHPDRDLELEIYQSGNDFNLMLSWVSYPDSPLLWQGQHPVWMDASNGKRCEAPKDGIVLESLARRLRALIEPPSNS